MAFKEVIDLNADETKKLEKVGEKQQGYYLGFRVNESSFGVSRLHVFKTDKGTVGIWGSSMLDEKLSRVLPGTMTQVTFEGKDTLKGGRTLKKFKVLSDDTNTIDVGSIVANDTAEVSEDYNDIPEEAFEDTEIADEAPRVALTKGKPQSFSSGHQASVNGLLSKK